jgi:hypothetical protein
MALKGGSLIVGATATALSGAIPGTIRCRSLTFNSVVANTGVVAVGGSDVQVDGHPAYFSISPGGSYTPPPPADGLQFEVDFSKLYCRSTAGTEALQIVYID